MRLAIAGTLLLWALVVAFCVLLVATTSEEPITPLTALPNTEFLASLGTPVTIEDGCVFWGGESKGIRTAIYMNPDAAADAVRIVAVCAPTP